MQAWPSQACSCTTLRFYVSSQLGTGKASKASSLRLPVLRGAQGREMRHMYDSVVMDRMHMLDNELNVQSAARGNA